MRQPKIVMAMAKESSTNMDMAKESAKNMKTEVTDIGVDVGLEDATAMVMEKVAMVMVKVNVRNIMATVKVNMATERENTMATVETIIILLIESASTNSQTF